MAKHRAQYIYQNGSSGIGSITSFSNSVFNKKITRIELEYEPWKRKKTECVFYIGQKVNPIYTVKGKYEIELEDPLYIQGLAVDKTSLNDFQNTERLIITIDYEDE